MKNALKNLVVLLLFAFIASGACNADCVDSEKDSYFLVVKEGLPIQSKVNFSGNSVGDVLILSDHSLWRVKQASGSDLIYGDRLVSIYKDDTEESSYLMMVDGTTTEFLVEPLPYRSFVKKESSIVYPEGLGGKFELHNGSKWVVKGILGDSGIKTHQGHEGGAAIYSGGNLICAPAIGEVSDYFMVIEEGSLVYFIEPELFDKDQIYPIFSDGASSGDASLTERLAASVGFLSVSLPFSDTAEIPANVMPGTVIRTEHNGIWVVTDGGSFGTSHSENIYVYQDGSSIKISCLNSGITYTVTQIPNSESLNIPFSDTAEIPSNVMSGTVITTARNGMWVVTDGGSFGTSHSENIYVYQDGSSIKMSCLNSGITYTVIKMPDSEPILGDVLRPANMMIGTILMPSNNQIWKVVSGGAFGSARMENIVIYRLGLIYNMSFQSSGVVVEVELVNSGVFSDTAEIPSNVMSGTVITTEHNGMLVVTDGGSFGTSHSENIYVYQDGSSIKISCLNSGIVYTVIEMPDSDPIFSSVLRPANILVGTILMPSNGQIWKVVSGGAFGSAATENIVIYRLGLSYNMSFQSSGVVVEVELLSDAPSYSLTVNKSGLGGGAITSNPAGISCGNDCSESYSQGTSVTLTANPEPNSNFMGWSGSCTNATGSCTLTMNAAKQVTARFEPVPITYSLSISKVGSGTITSSPAGIDCGATCTASFASDADVTLTATPASGYSFGNWSGCTPVAGLPNQCTLGLTANRAVTATFVSERVIAIPEIAGTSGTARQFRIRVPDGRSQLTVRTQGANGEVDLYVRRGTAATTTAFDCRSVTSGPNETCTLSAPAGGDYYLLLHAITAYTDLTLSVIWPQL